MNKVTKEQLQDYASELGNMQTEHRRGSTFYADCSYTFKQADIDTLKEEGVDASDFLNVCVTLSGYYDDNNGCDWDSMSFCKVEEYQELVPMQVIPEVVIPEHYITKQRTEAFVPTWE